jgi:hypothetical protein
VKIGDSGDDTRALIFLHVPKTAGTTLNQILWRQYQSRIVHRIQKIIPGRSVEDFRAMTEAEKSRVRIVTGHIDFGFHEFLPRPCEYITILRDPVDRIISHYYYVSRDPNHYLYPEVKGRKLTLADYVRSGLTPELDNAQVKQIAGEFVGYGQCTRGHLERAKRNITDHFVVAGLSERFDETLLLLKRQLHWSAPYYVKENVTPNRPSRDNIDPAARRAIEEVNALDMELWEFVRNRMDQQIAAYGEAFARDLDAFRRRNARHGRVRLFVRGIRIRLRFLTGKWKPVKLDE